jgi:hypothetical protein
MVYAVQLLFVDPAQAPAAQELECDYWKGAGRDLAPGHAILIGQGPPEEWVEASPRYGRVAAGTQGAGPDAAREAVRHPHRAGARGRAPPVPAAFRRCPGAC